VNSFDERLQSVDRLVLGTGTVPGSLPVNRYPGIFITRLLSTHHCR